MRETTIGRRYARTSSIAAGLVLSASSLVGCAPVEPPEKPECAYVDKREEIIVTTDQLVRCLGALAVKGKAPDADYDRDRLFGSRFRDILEQCGARDVVLQRDMDREIVAPDGCEVIGGPFLDPYSGELISKVTDTNTEIDHVVSLHDAWLKGAQNWDKEKRIAFANDPLNLRATQRAMNRAKSDGDAATWLPPNKSFRCELVGGQVIVKERYDLWVTPAEKGAIARELGKCAGKTFTIPDKPTSLATI